MHVVIAGCGRVGSGIAQNLVGEGHDVTVIDEDPDSFELLGDDFPGQFVTGAAIDWDVLKEAGIEEADAFVAVTDGDNTNIVCAQIAQRAFGITCVVARVYDPVRAEVFGATGIRTVSPTRDARSLLLDAVHSCQLPQREN
jgi:trk system potassium uptake protein TrkA